MTGHLIHIGYPKTGSMFLRRWFRMHPQLLYAEGGIAGFRNVYEIARSAAAPKKDILYRVTSSEALSTPHIFVGEQVVDYDRIKNLPVAQAEACNTLAALFPTAKVLIITRGFRSILLSSYSQFLRAGGRYRFEEFVQSAGPAQAWNYDFVISLYTRAFGESNVIVMPYEFLRDDAGRFVGTLADRLGLAPIAPDAGRINPSLSAIEMYWYPRLTRRVHALPIGNALKRLYVLGVRANRFRRVISVLQRFRRGSAVDDAAIDEQFVDSYRGKAESLRGNPLYGPYADEYLHR